MLDYFDLMDQREELDIQTYLDLEKNEVVENLTGDCKSQPE